MPTHNNSHTNTTEDGAVSTAYAGPAPTAPPPSPTTSNAFSDGQSTPPTPMSPTKATFLESGTLPQELRVEGALSAGFFAHAGLFPSPASPPAAAADRAQSDGLVVADWFHELERAQTQTQTQTQAPVDGQDGPSGQGDEENAADEQGSAVAKDLSEPQSTVATTSASVDGSGPSEASRSQGRAMRPRVTKNPRFSPYAPSGEKGGVRGKYSWAVEASRSSETDKTG